VGFILWIRSVSAVSVQVDGLTLALARPGLRLEVPCDAIEEIVPWRLPFPDPGLDFRMRSGRRLRYGVALCDPLPVLEGLAGVGGVEAAARVVGHPSIVYAHAKAAHRKGWVHLFAKFVVFSLLLAAIELAVDWNSVEGGPQRGDVLLGVDSYLGSLAIYWAGTLIYLIFYAGVWRALAEMVSLAAAWLRTGVQAVRVRQVAEITCAVAYYAGAPLLPLLF
jgi:apolipoprotein N-acyltransferase